MVVFAPIIKDTLIKRQDKSIVGLFEGNPLSHTSSTLMRTLSDLIYLVTDRKIIGAFMRFRTK
jgi:hypothetical protein